jgi:hypothetical protein
MGLEDEIRLTGKPKARVLKMGEHGSWGFVGRRIGLRVGLRCYIRRCGGGCVGVLRQHWQNARRDHQQESQA